MNMNLDLIKYPVFSDKSKFLLKENKYVFLVDLKLTKTLAKSILENLFSVKILAINSYVLPLKKRGMGNTRGSKTSYKRIIVTLAEGNSISLFQGI